MTARWVVFAYHTFGARALAGLLARGETVAAVVTHEDQPAEGDWFESVADVARGARRAGAHARVAERAGGRRASRRARRRRVPLRLVPASSSAIALLALPRVAALNLHGSLLPAYRGRAPLNWVLVNGETRTGVTLHHMTAEADAGDIVAQEPIDILPDDTAAHALRPHGEGRRGSPAPRRTPRCSPGRRPRRPRITARATVVGRRRPEDGRVAWTWPAAAHREHDPRGHAPVSRAPSSATATRACLPLGRPPSATRTAHARPGTVVAVHAGQRHHGGDGAGHAAAHARPGSRGTPKRPADRWARGAGASRRAIALDGRSA